MIHLKDLTSSSQDCRECSWRRNAHGQCSIKMHSKAVTRNQTGYASRLYCLQLGLDCEITYQNTGLGIVYQLTQQGWSREWRHVVWIVRRYWIFRDEVSVDDGLISFKCIRECKEISVLVW